MDEITFDVAELCTAIEASRDRAGRARVKPALREKLIAYARSQEAAGVSRAEVAAQLRLSLGNLHRWLATGSRSKRKKLKRVTVVDPSTVTVHARHGVRVEGLTIAQVAELLRTL